MEFAKCVRRSCIIFQMRRSRLPGINKLLHSLTFQFKVIAVELEVSLFIVSFIKDCILLINYPSKRKQYEDMHIIVMEDLKHLLACDYPK